MKAKMSIEVIPIWFIQKWSKDNCEDNSALDFWIKQMIHEWKLEEIRMRREGKRTG